MAVTAKLRYLRISPRKVRLVADLVRGKSVGEAETILNFAIKKSTVPLLKLLKGAVANAQNNFQLDPGNLYISKIFIEEAPKLKRWRARARGQAYEIQKKVSHVVIILEEQTKTKKKVEKVKKSKIITEKTLLKEETKEKTIEREKPKPKPKNEIVKPRIEKGAIKKIFRRKAF